MKTNMILEGVKNLIACFFLTSGILFFLFLTFLMSLDLSSSDNLITILVQIGIVLLAINLISLVAMVMGIQYPFFAWNGFSIQRFNGHKLFWKRLGILTVTVWLGRIAFIAYNAYIALSIRTASAAVFLLLFCGLLIILNSTYWLFGIKSVPEIIITLYRDPIQLFYRSKHKQKF